MIDRRAFTAGALALVPAAAAAQLGQSLPQGGGRAPRPAVDEALRRTVTLVLRSAARSGSLPDFATNPEPLSEELLAELRVGARLSPEFPANAMPDAINNRLPHVRGGSIWAAAGTWLIEVDPVRLVVLTVAPDMLPPDVDVRPPTASDS
ncbi:MAG: hypothetical protein ACK4WC_00780 [Rubrimonas sp.]